MIFFTCLYFSLVSSSGTVIINFIFSSKFFSFEEIHWIPIVLYIIESLNKFTHGFVNVTHYLTEFFSHWVCLEGWRLKKPGLEFLTTSSCLQSEQPTGGGEWTEAFTFSQESVPSFVVPWGQMGAWSKCGPWKFIARKSSEEPMILAEYITSGGGTVVLP